MNALQVKENRKRMGLTQEELGLKLGVSKRTIINYEQGTLIPESKEKLLHIIFNEKVQNKVEAISVDYKEMQVMYVPLINQYAYAGYMNGFSDHEYIDSLPKIPFSADQEHKGEYLCFEVKGDSMDDGTVDAILERDILLCRNVRKEHWINKLHINRWDFVIVHREKGIVVKRILKHDVEKGILTLHSLNEDYDDYEVHLRDVSQILNIVDIKRNRKR